MPTRYALVRYLYLLWALVFLAACGQPATENPDLLAAARGGGADIDVSRSEAVFSGVRGTTSAAQKVVVKNAGDAPLTVRLAVIGAHRNAFAVSLPRSPLVLEPGSAETLQVRFAPGRRQVGALRAALRIVSNDPAERRLVVGLYGLSARGEQGGGEPSLQAIVRTLGYTVNVGRRGLILGTRPWPIGDEVRVSLFQKAGLGPVTMTPIARYSPDDSLPYGTYTGTSKPVRKTVGTIATGYEQTLYPATTPGSRTDFEPNGSVFGFFVGSTSYAPHKTYTQDAFNTGPIAHAVRVYPLKNRRGQRLPNCYLLAFEPASNGDYQDYVFVVKNVKPL